MKVSDPWNSAKVSFDSFEGIGSHDMFSFEEPVRGVMGKCQPTKLPMKVWKPKRTKHSLVLGMDIGLEYSCSLTMCALVGRMTYRHYCKRSVVEWMKASWEPIMGYSVELLMLPRGWFSFVFKSLEDSTRILERFWVFEGNNLMLKRWRLKFDLATKYFSFRHLWVFLL
jgi:hypothetical protein